MAGPRALMIGWGVVMVIVGFFVHVLILGIGVICIVLGVVLWRRDED